MYAVKPWGNVLLIGAGVGTYAMGVGMRWRESNVSVVERKRSPTYELNELRRCVVTNQTVKLLADLGVTEWKIRSALRPTRGWRFSDHSLRVLKESTTFPGCALGEESFHCSEGALMRLLRSEMLRFGGSVLWESEAYEPFESGDGSDTWCLRKDFGLGSGAEAIITTAQNTALEELLFSKDPNRLAIAFSVETGICQPTVEERVQLFGDSDVCIVIGSGTAIHFWLMHDNRCSFRIVTSTKVPPAKPQVRGDGGKGEDADADQPEPQEPTGVSRQLTHPLLRKLTASATNVKKTTCFLPGTVPAVRDEATRMRISVLGDGLLKVDPFEWRGDNCRTLIEEASSLCRLFYGKKYHRGDVAFLLRELEQDCISKRANLLRRDLLDAEHFLEVNPRLESGSQSYATHSVTE